MTEDIGEVPVVVREKWNATFEKRVKDPKRRSSWHSKIVQKHLRDDWLGGHTVTSYLVDYLKGRKLKRGLEIGGGMGHQARAFLHGLNIDQFDVVDISTFAVDEGNKRAREEGINMSFSVADLNNEPLPKGPYDLIIASGALHHIENLEHLFAEVAKKLSPKGVFFANDYMGPNHMQWTEDQLRLMNEIVQALPDEMNVVAHRHDAVIRDVKRIPLEIFAKHDPSEGVRAADIFEVMDQHLHIERIIPIGQTLAYEVLRGRMQNFDDDDPKDSAILHLICLLEKELIAAGTIQSDFNLVIAKRLG